VLQLPVSEQDLVLGLLILARVVMMLAQRDYDYRHSYGHICTCVSSVHSMLQNNACIAICAVPVFSVYKSSKL
jgi:hypothetical protein